MRAALFGLGLLTSIAPAWAQPLSTDPLAALINAYRTNPAKCDGAPVAPVAPLVAEPALAQIRIGFGTFIESALAQAGYAADNADSVDVTGPEDAVAAVKVLQQRYCKVLRSEQFSAVGSYREGTTWAVVLARPAPPLPSTTYPDWRDAGRAILEAVNVARASARMCGDRAFAAAPPLQWNAVLGETALAHSRDMATRRYFNHYAQDGSDPADRATRAGYRWHRLGENIAFGQHLPQEAVDGWIDSPGHCANIMQADFTEMGAAYGVTADRQAGIIYWTQVFGTPR